MWEINIILEEKIFNGDQRCEKTSLRASRIDSIVENKRRNSLLVRTDLTKCTNSGENTATN